MLNAFFVMYRESFEAILIVGILYAYLKRQTAADVALKYMWGGIASGLVLSALLAAGLHLAQTEFEGAALEHFNNFIIFTAIILMTHMCIWMKRHARTIKSDLQSGLSESVSKSEYWGIAVLSGLAVAREGSETVIFLYSVAVESIENKNVGPFLITILLGLFASAMTWIIFNRGLRFFKPQVFFRVTTIILFITASSLTLSLARKLIQAEVIPALKDPVWDTSFLIDEGSRFGGLFSGVTGYQSTPALMTVLIFLAYWTITAFFYFRASKPRPTTD